MLLDNLEGEKGDQYALCLMCVSVFRGVLYVCERGNTGVRFIFDYPVQREKI